jgi:hypothetical protein
MTQQAYTNQEDFYRRLADFKGAFISAVRGLGS